MQESLNASFVDFKNKFLELNLNDLAAKVSEYDRSYRITLINNLMDYSCRSEYKLRIVAIYELISRLSKHDKIINLDYWNDVEASIQRDNPCVFIEEYECIDDCADSILTELLLVVLSLANELKIDLISGFGLPPLQENKEITLPMVLEAYTKERCQEDSTNITAEDIITLNRKTCEVDELCTNKSLMESVQELFKAILYSIIKITFKQAQDSRYNIIDLLAAKILYHQELSIL